MGAKNDLSSRSLQSNRGNEICIVKNQYKTKMFELGLSGEEVGQKDWLEELTFDGDFEE